jgi:hypothetical protein
MVLLSLQRNRTALSTSSTAASPFELLVHVIRAQGVMVGGTVRAEVVVDGVIAGLTDSSKVQQGAAPPGEVAVAGTGNVVWDAESSFSVPLASVASHSLRINLFREFDGNHKNSTVVGHCQNDRMLSKKLWSRVNR